MRRTLALTALVALAAAFVLTLRGDQREAPSAARRGHRVFRVAAGAVQELEITTPQRRFVARRDADGWYIDGKRAPAAAGAALDDAVGTLADLRAVDVFRPRDGTSYGLDQPRATIVLHTRHAIRRVVLGAPNAAGSAFYARRDGDPRVMQVGSSLLSALERVFFATERRAMDSGPRQRPDISNWPR